MCALFSKHLHHSRGPTWPKHWPCTGSVFPPSFESAAPAVLRLKAAQEEKYSEKCLEQLSLINFLLAISRYSNNISYNVLTTLVSVIHTRYNINDRAWDIGLLCIGDG